MLKSLKVPNDAFSGQVEVTTEVDSHLEVKGQS
jgi:hypothetical protein